VPFLYELKALLDWSVTPTTLTLVDWFKLEDIRASLYNRQCDLLMRGMNRRVGQAQPTLPKFLMGFFLFSAVLALLWTPLLAFSSSNPTFQTPRITDFTFNASLLHFSRHHSTVEAISLPVFSSTMQHSVSPWLRNSSASELTRLPKSLAAYAPAQLQLLCGGMHSDRAWQRSPEVRARFQELLVEEARGGTASSASKIWLDIGFSTLRSFPPETAYGGPLCSSAVRVQLSCGAAAQLASVMQGRQEWALLDGWHGVAGSDGVSQPKQGLFGWVWQLKEHKCIVQPIAEAIDVAPAPQGGSKLSLWPLFQVHPAIYLIYLIATFISSGPSTCLFRLALDHPSKPTG
jgi:hypothetical protein